MQHSDLDGDDVRTLQGLKMVHPFGVAVFQGNIISDLKILTGIIPEKTVTNFQFLEIKINGQIKGYIRACILFLKPTIRECILYPCTKFHVCSLNIYSKKKKMHHAKVAFPEQLLKICYLGIYVYVKMWIYPQQ